MNNYRRAYFKLVDSVCKDTGNSRYDLHDRWKERILPFLMENPDNFIDGTLPDYFTTTVLSDSGWEIFYNEWQHFCIDTFNISN